MHILYVYLNCFKNNFIIFITMDTHLKNNYFTFTFFVIIYNYNNIHIK